MTGGTDWAHAGEALPTGTVVRVDDGDSVNGYPATAGMVGRVIGARGRIVAVRFSPSVFRSAFPSPAHGPWNVPAEFHGPNVAAYDVDWLSVIVYVRAERIPATDTAGTKIRVRERYAPRRQLTFPYPYDARDAREACVTEFARTVVGMLRPEASVAFERGRVVMYAVRDTGTCECSPDDYGPCEFHAETLVTREGSSSRSADELCSVFLSDAMAVAPDGTFSDEFRAADLRLGNALADSGGAWMDSADDSDELRDRVGEAENALGAIGLSTYWDDGYRIVRITGGPMASDA